MANPYRGEVEAVIDGSPATLRLTLGALAELEAALAAEGLVDLAERFDRGAMRSADVIAVLTAGLRGAGRMASRDEVAAMAFEGGAVGAARLAGRLLAVAFTGAAA
jgi:Phage tail tube protein, GTA-gp10